MKRVLAIAALLFASTAMAEVYKCPDPSTGKNVFQDSPCDGSVKRTVPQEAPQRKEFTPRKPGQRDSSKAYPTMADADWGVRNVLFAYSRCTRAYGEMGAKYGSSYRLWRGRNTASIEKVQGSNDYAEGMKLIDQDLAKRGELPPAFVEMQRQECEFLLQRALSKP